MLSKNLEATLNRALALATKYKHEYATCEHLLLALISDQDAEKILLSCNVQTAKLSMQLEDYLQQELAALINNSRTDARPTAGFQKVLSVLQELIF
jgi:ATP-dependent Clp protease ATP-binding subunit ClpA